MAKFNEGDDVWLVRHYARLDPTRTTVTKVGRRYFEVANYRGRFVIETGKEDGAYTGAEVRTPAEQDRVERALAVHHQLKPLGIVIEYEARRDIPVETLEQIAVLVAEATA